LARLFGKNGGKKRTDGEKQMAGRQFGEDKFRANNTPLSL
jgi:hypothetical protein